MSRPDVVKRALQRIVAVILLMVIGVLFFGVFTVADVYFYRCPDVVAADGALVLGTLVQNGQVSASFKGRLDKAVELFRRGVISTVAVSGTVTTAGELSEGEAGARYLKQQGIPTDRIIVESRARSTYENIVFGAQEFSRYGLRSWVIVSDPYHLRRASLIAEQKGIVVGCVAVDNSVRNSFGFLLSEAYKVVRLRLSIK